MSIFQGDDATRAALVALNKAHEPFYLAKKTKTHNVYFRIVQRYDNTHYIKQSRMYSHNTVPNITLLKPIISFTLGVN